MSLLLNNFIIFRDFPPNLTQNIKSFYVSKYKLNFNSFGYCVLNDNRVYGLGEGIHVNLGYDCSEVKYILINELNDKHIEEFYEGNDCMFARNKNNQIFSWGKDVCGLLARGHSSGEYLKPDKINFFDDKNIIDISCGAWHCLALSSDGIVYGWGDNRKGQIGCGQEHGEFIYIPIEIDLKKEKIKLIQCRSWMSFAINDNIIYYWGQISDSSETLYNPLKLEEIIKEKIKIKSIIKKFSDPIFSLHLYVLSFDGIIYEFCDERLNLKTFYDLNESGKENTIIDLYIDSDRRVVFETQESVYVYHNSKVEKTSYKTLFEYLLFEEQKTYKTIHIKDIKDLKINEQNKFHISQALSEILESNIKYYYQSERYSNNYFGLFVMNDNRVYCLGDNSKGKLGLGHNIKIYEYTEIIELRDKNIQEFYEGRDFMFARNDQNEIFSWGLNMFGQLGRGYQSEEYLRPEKINFFDGKNIIEISCGLCHCLALSSDGRLFGWGDNRKGQVRCGEEQEEIISTPTKIDLKEKIKFIHCARDMSFAVSFDGNSYYWGRIELNEMFEKTIINPILIALKNVSKVYYSYSWKKFIILYNNGKVFLFNALNKEINVIKSEEEFNDLYCDDDYCLLQTEDSVFKVEKQAKNDMKLIKTDFFNFFDFYSQKIHNYKKTIEISKGGDLMEKQIQFNEKEKILILKNQLIFDTKYEKGFEEISEISRGTFGTVYQVQKRSNKIDYAVKIAEIIDEMNLSEIKIMSKLSTEFVVQYIDSWIEVKLIFKRIKKFLFIQMELCSMNLRDFIKFLNELFSDRFQTFQYFISCELFKELIESVNYLHSLNPPIIHRNLKPENILISDGINGRFLKLCDFGLSKIHEISNHTRMVGSLNYMAPEVLHSNQYNTKSDIYSLAIIGSEMFGYKDNLNKIRNYKTHRDFFQNYPQYLRSNVEQQFKSLLKTLSNCLVPENYHSRPDCKQLLNEINLIYVNKDIFWNHEDVSNLKHFYNQKLRKYNKAIQSTIKIYFENKEIPYYERVFILEPTIKVLDKYYNNTFEQIERIGKGNSGEVWKVHQNNKYFDIKSVLMNRDDFDDYFKEIRIISILDDFKFVVEYIDSWIEEEYCINKVQKHLFIQMEYCSQSLRKFINLIKEISDEKYNTFNYFISCELFLELIKSLDYLHSIPEPDGPITHRDLNPNNILISDGINGQFLKLCDFGLSKVYKNSYLSKPVSTPGYDPPEMWCYPRKYTPKSDIYSLAIIATEIFHFNDSIGKIRAHKKREDFNQNLTKYSNSNLENKFKILLDTISDCVTRGAKDYDLRPDCKELLTRSTKFSIDKSFVFKDDNITHFITFLEKPEYLLLKKFFKTKMLN